MQKKTPQKTKAKQNDNKILRTNAKIAYIAYRLVSARLVEAENFDSEASVKIFSLDESYRYADIFKNSGLSNIINVFKKN